MPEKSVAALSGSRIAAARALRTDAASGQAATKQPHAVPYTRLGPRAYSSPPAAGPTICAVWVAEADHAVAREIAGRGTMPGINADIVGFSNAPAAPAAATSARIPGGRSHPVPLPMASVAATPP